MAFPFGLRDPDLGSRITAAERHTSRNPRTHSGSVGSGTSSIGRRFGRVGGIGPSLIFRSDLVRGSDGLLRDVSPTRSRIRESRGGECGDRGDEGDQKCAVHPEHGVPKIALLGWANGDARRTSFGANRKCRRDGSRPVEHHRAPAGGSRLFGAIRSGFWTAR